MLSSAIPPITRSDLRAARSRTSATSSINDAYCCDHAIEAVDAYPPSIVRALTDYYARRCDTTVEAMLDAIDYPSDPSRFVVQTTCIEELTFDATVWMMNPHMHTPSTKIETSSDGGETWRTLIDIPRWDWHWEGEYTLSEGIPVAADDSIRLSCSFDNGTEAQPD